MEQEHFNHLHSNIRTVMEYTFGVKHDSIDCALFQHDLNMRCRVIDCNTHFVRENLRVEFFLHI
jgi:hypothetical protein